MAEFEVELDSCAGARRANREKASKSKVRTYIRAGILIFGAFEDGREILREGGAGQHLGAAGGVGLGGEVALDVGEEGDDAKVWMRLPQSLDGGDGIVARVEVDDDELGGWIDDGEEGVGVGGNFYFDAQVLGGFGKFHLEEKIVHEGGYSAH